MQAFFTFIFANFPLTFLLLGTAAVAIAVARSGRAHLAEAAMAFYCLFCIGFTFLYNFVMHVFFGAVAARFIGWADSPFQAEVGWASLGFATIGLLAWRMGFELRLAAVVGPACFLLGAAAGHVEQMIVARNFAPGNAGVIFWADLVVPALGALLLWLRYGRFSAGRGA